MHSLFHSNAPESDPVVEPVPTVFPTIEGADIAAAFVGKRVAGDFYDSLRAGPERVLFGLLDIAGRREENRSILTAAQEIFRNAGTELFSSSDINESEAMTELSRRVNRGLLEAHHAVHPCPAFIGCYHEKFGTLCYSNAGHTPALLRDHGGIVELGSTGLPLGLFSHVTSDAPTIGIEKDAALLLVSRGVVDCERRVAEATEKYGIAGVKQFFQDAPPSTAKELCAFVLSPVGTLNGHILRCDDQTALALVRTA
jgi:serine phosphatase RsbU (regulator of sigma subunit)